VPTSLGAHNQRIAFARELLSKRGRREHRRFTFEGATLLDEAIDANVQIDALYVTASVFDASKPVQRLEAAGVPVYLIDDRNMRRISDVETPPGLLAVAPIRLAPASALFGEAGTVLALADIGDPGNAGTLVRTAEAFGISRVLFGTGGVEPYLPKVVRSAMGAIFRQRIALGRPEDLPGTLVGWQVTGLDPSGSALQRLDWGDRELLVVGSERRGLGHWSALCTRLAGIPMPGHAESLNASAAGSIAMYEAVGRRSP
jgi:RNA methyltransferase, TrmH family